MKKHKQTISQAFAFWQAPLLHYYFQKNNHLIFTLSKKALLAIMVDVFDLNQSALKQVFAWCHNQGLRLNWQTKRQLKHYFDYGQVGVLPLFLYQLTKQFQPPKHAFQVIVNLTQQQITKMSAKEIAVLAQKIQYSCLSYQKNINNLLTYKNAYLFWNKQQKQPYDFAVVVFNQQTFDFCANKEEFIAFVYQQVNFVYTHLKNYHACCFIISDIYDQKHNLKWEIYALLVVYASHFINITIPQTYHQPHLKFYQLVKWWNIIQLQPITNKHLNHLIHNCDIASLHNYFATDTSKLQKMVQMSQVIPTGLSYRDTLVNTHTNNNNITIIFYKYETDLTKLPCPVCNQMILKSNSYTKFGIKSWECNNPTCWQKSANNRGKRFSAKSNYMQYFAFQTGLKNQIPSAIQKAYRRDLSCFSSLTSQINALVTLFSYSNQQIFCNIAYTHPDRFLQTATWQKPSQQLIQQWRDSVFMQWIMQMQNFHQPNVQPPQNVFMNNNLFVACDDAKNFVFNSSFSQKIDLIITSPPYYNVRNYAQWMNLYGYFYDLSVVLFGCKQLLKKQGLFFINVSDVIDNPNWITNTKMGKIKIPLGAYLFFLFLKQQYQFVTTWIWDKGEIHSKRHLNGPNIAHYHFPINCYEYVFAFALPNNLVNKTMPTKLVMIQPVKKINIQKKNIIGHSAPFPQKLSDQIIATFAPENAVVADVFLGSGTTLLSVQKYHKKGIGVEIKHDYFRLALQKLNQTNK